MNYQKITLLHLLILIAGCSASQVKDKKINIEEKEDIKIENISKNNQLEIKFTCTKDTIKKYLEKGWIIDHKKERDVTCTWKSIPASKNCDMDKDKGCKLTVPDKRGKEVTYYLKQDNIKE